MARSSSRNAVSFSSAGTTKRFPSPRCTSATILSDRTTPLLANATVWNGQLAARLFWLAEKHLETHWRKERVPQAERNDFFNTDLSQGGGPTRSRRARGVSMGNAHSCCALDNSTAAVQRIWYPLSSLARDSHESITSDNERALNRRMFRLNDLYASLDRDPSFRGCAGSPCRLF